MRSSFAERLSSSQYLQLPDLCNWEGKPRRFGFEVEFGAVSLKEAAEVIKLVFGGDIKVIDPFVYEVQSSEYGKFSVEEDSTFVKEKGGKLIQWLKESASQNSADKAAAFIEDLTDGYVPKEITTAPLLVEDVPKVEELCRQLVRRNAQGTKQLFVSAFALHINPEIASRSAIYLTSILKAFLLLEDELVEELDIDLARRLAPYIRLFPSAYKAIATADDYWPNLDALIKDYKRHNPSRNRPLDLYPLFKFLNPASIDEAVEDHNLIKARPTFHYRLPNCDLENPDWTVASQWNSWARIESEAARLRAMRNS